MIGRLWIYTLLALVWLSATTLTAHAAERPEGVLWNRSGLAATLPLLVKTQGGTDYLLTLRDADTEKAVFAAYIRGGDFFRVLVPPGHYALVFAAGTGWQGEQDLFGPGTHHFTLETPLDFGATVARRNGHIVDLRDPGRVLVNGYTICQTLTVEPPRLLRAEDFTAEGVRARLSQPPEPGFTTRSRFCE